MALDAYYSMPKRVDHSACRMSLPSSSFCILFISRRTPPPLMFRGGGIFFQMDSPKIPPETFLFRRKFRNNPQRSPRVPLSLEKILIRGISRKKLLTSGNRDFYKKKNLKFAPRGSCRIPAQLSAQFALEKSDQAIKFFFKVESVGPSK